MTRPKRIAVLGAGTVGAAVVGRLDGMLGATVGPVLVRDPQRERAFAGWRERVTTDAGRALEGAEVVVELLGGVEPAAALMLRALQDGARVVTANKAALAERWDEFAPYLAQGRLYLEASVMAGTPVVGALAGALRGAAPVALHAVLNGTCNVILSRMEGGASYASALAEAQELGFAEADPTLDVEGLDSAHKLTVLGRLAFDPALRYEQVRAHTTGITALEASAVRAAAEAGARVRLVGSIVAGAAGWQASVRPLRLAREHPLAGLDGPTNGLLFRSDPLGEVFVRGPGAGGGATAAGVIGDVLAALDGRPGPAPLAQPATLPARGRREAAGALAAAPGTEP